ncbi:MAG: hypothetical protein HY075_15750 [Deltaproteobacteria bacterium]|nr:hypothetical protein [Deltaproteobacteria bacterium]
MSASRRILNAPNMLLHWPQLPKRARLERVTEQTYAALTTKNDDFARGSAAGWSAMWRLLKARPRSWINHTHFKSQITGPVTLFGRLQAGGLKGEQQLPKYVTLWLRHAYWQIDEIRERGFKPVLVLDEPLLPTYLGPSGSSRERKLLKLLRSITKRLKRRGALVGVHCCNRVSPATLVGLGVDLVHFDAFHFPTQLARARVELQSFMRDGGIVAWGMIPAEGALSSAGQARIEKSLGDLLASMEGRGLPLRRVLSQSMVAPTCGTGSLSADESQKVMDFAVALSRQLKTRYKLTL